MSMPSSLPDQSVAIAIADPLGVKPADIGKYLHVAVGDTVTKETKLAEKKALMGIGGVALQSPVEGTISGIDTERGLVTILISQEPLLSEPKTEPIQQLEPPQEVPAQIPETVPERKDPKQPQVKNGKSIGGLFGVGKNQGNGWYVRSDFSQKSLVAEMADHVLLLTKLPILAEIYKASAIGVAGIVVAPEEMDATRIDEITKAISGKSRVAFLVLPKDANLSILHSVLLEVDGDGKQLVVFGK